MMFTHEDKDIALLMNQDLDADNWKVCFLFISRQILTHKTKTKKQRRKETQATSSWKLSKRAQ